MKLPHIFGLGRVRRRTVPTVKRAQLRVEQLESWIAPAGTFTGLQNLLPVPSGGTAGSATMIQLTDGSVLIQGSGQSNGPTASWYRLLPDSGGNYVNGTFSAAGSMGTPRLFYGSNVLPNGKVFAMGGEDTAQGNTDTNTGEIFDPSTDAWTPIAANFPQPHFGDDPTMLIPGDSSHPDGQVLAGYISDRETYLFNPDATSPPNVWTGTGTSLPDGTLGKIHADAYDVLAGDPSAEENWVLLSNNSVLSYDIYSSLLTSGLPGVFQA